MTTFEKQAIAIKPQNNEATQFNPFGLKIASNYYLHGEVEKMNQYDLVGFMGEKTTDSGVYPTKLYFDKVTTIDCTMFVWEGNEGHRGLVVMNIDTEAMEYAQKHYDAKSSNL